MGSTDYYDDICYMGSNNGMAGRGHGGEMGQEIEPTGDDRGPGAPASRSIIPFDFCFSMALSMTSRLTSPGTVRAEELLARLKEGRSQGKSCEWAGSTALGLGPLFWCCDMMTMRWTSFQRAYNQLALACCGSPISCCLSCSQTGVAVLPFEERDVRPLVEQTITITAEAILFSHPIYVR